ncbi:hypothetical protein AAG570_002548 [Ranatra chinensis]|uniref:RNA-directed DNA polymerase n=1 Tax=Ranatra chinensis TaxID=642074 RepID=A0ABD0Y7V5_9HEMI
MKIQLDKCEFLRKQVNYLGHRVTADGIKPNTDKIKAITEYTIPKTPKQLKGFLGLLGYYRKFIPNFAAIVKPLTTRLKKDHTINISDKDYVECFHKCKQLLTNEPLLQYPDFDKPFILTTDASEFAIGAVLSQGTIGSDRPIAFASRTLNEHERNYSTIEKELLAIIYGTKYFRPYLFGRHFIIVTDHKPLQWLFSLKEPNSKLIRWRLSLEEYDYEIRYKPGKQNSNADALSRAPNLNVNTDDLTEEHKAFLDRLLDDFTQRNDDNHPDTSTAELEDSPDGTTTVSACQITNSDDPLNFGKNQIYFISVKTKPQPVELVRLFGSSKEDIEDKNDQTNVIKDYHEGKTNHRGMTETLAKLSKIYYWPNQQKSVQNYINTCDICKQVKYDRKPLKLKFNITPTPSKPFEIIHMDVLKYEHAKLLTVVDAFTKYAQAYVLKSSQAIDISENLLHYFSHHGTPDLIIADNGPEFDNGLINEFLTLHKIKIHFCSPHHPASNGIIERFHSTFLDHLNLLNNRQEFKRDSFTLKVQFALIAYNNSTHSITGKTPFEILSGNENQPIDINLESRIVNNYIQNHKDKINVLYEMINKKLLEHKTKTISKLNEKRETIPQLPKTVYVKSNFRSKSRNRYQKEEVLDVDPEKKTLKPKINAHKTGRKFNKLHIENVKRPNKTTPVAGPSSSSEQ